MRYFFLIANIFLLSVIAFSGSNTSVPSTGSASGGLTNTQLRSSAVEVTGSLTVDPGDALTRHQFLNGVSTVSTITNAVRIVSSNLDVPLSTINTALNTLNTNVATASRQDTGNSSLSSLDTKITTAGGSGIEVNLKNFGGTGMSVGTKTSTGSMPVVANSESIASQTITALAGTVTGQTTGSSTAVISIIGTWTGTLNFDGITNDADFVSVICQQDKAGFPIGTMSETTTNGKFICPIGGINQLRVRATSWTSGTAVVSIFANLGTNAVRVVTSSSLPVFVQSSNFDVALSTRLKAADTLTGVTTLGSITSNVNVQSSAGLKVQPVDSSSADLTSANGTQTSRALGVQQLHDAGRTHNRFYWMQSTVGTSGTETLMSMQSSIGTAAIAKGTSRTITSGKKYRINSVTFGIRGSGAASAASSVLSLRLNTAGACTATSTPIVLQTRVAMPAIASSYDRVVLPFSEGYEIAGDGTLQFCLSTNSQYTTNTPTLDFIVDGYEY